MTTEKYEREYSVRLGICLEAVRAFLRDEFTAFGSLRSEYTDHMRLHLGFKWRICGLATRAEILQLYLNINAGGTPHTQSELEFETPSNSSTSTHKRMTTAISQSPLPSSLVRVVWSWLLGIMPRVRASTEESFKRFASKRTSSASIFRWKDGVGLALRV